MSGRLYGRVCRVTIAVPVATPGDYGHVTNDVLEVGGSDDPAQQGGLRVKFSAKKSNEKEPNTAEITVTNLSASRRASLQQKGAKVTLEAGYAGTSLGRLFVGDARAVDHVRDGADWNTTLKIADGVRSFKHARFSESFAPGSTAGDVLRRLADASGLAVGNVPDAVLDVTTTFGQGYVVHGAVSASLDRLCKSLGLKWSAQDGALQVLRPGSTLKALVPELSPESGLVGSPEMGTPEKKGKPALLKFKFLLQPVVPGGQVKIRSARYDGYVVVKKVAYSGDTHGDEWYGEAEGVLLPGGGQQVIAGTRF